MLKDTDWIKQALLMPLRIAGQDVDQAKFDRTFTDARLKFIDTKPGGGIALNNPPGSHGLADPKIKNRKPGNTSQPINKSYGIGLRQSEMHDDNSDLLYLRFGHPSFTGMTTFISDFFNYEASVMARTGRSPGWMYTIGVGLGFVTMIPFIPYIALGYMAKKAYDAFTGGNKSTSFMQIKPDMYGFWGSVSWMYNALGVNMNIVYPYDPTSLTDAESEIVKAMKTEFPDLIDSNGLIDIFKVALRGQRLANQYRESMIGIIKGASRFSDLKSSIKSLTDTEVDTSGQDLSYSQYLNLYQSFEGTTQSGDAKKDENTNMFSDVSSWMGRLKESTVAGINDGADWLVLNVDHTKDWSMNWSNSIQDNPLSDKFNSISSQAKFTSAMLAGGNLGDGPVTGMIESIVGGVKDVTMGIADSYGFSGVAALNGAGLVDIEKIHGDSSFSTPATTYSVTIETPYGNRWSEYLFVMPTVCALIAGTMPISTGKHSYTSPFYCEAYLKGKLQIRKGMITDLTLTRATNNIGWTRSNRARGYKLEFTIAELSPAMHMPLNPMNDVWDGDTVFTDLLAQLSSMDMYHQLYAIPKLSVKMARLKAEGSMMFSADRMAMSFSDSLTGNILKSIARGTDIF